MGRMEWLEGVDSVCLLTTFLYLMLVVTLGQVSDVVCVLCSDY